MHVSTRRVARPVNLAHAARADHRDDLIRPEARARGQRQDSRSIEWLPASKEKRGNPLSPSSTSSAATANK